MNFALYECYCNCKCYGDCYQQDFHRDDICDSCECHNELPEKDYDYEYKYARMGYTDPATWDK